MLDTILAQTLTTMLRRRILDAELYARENPPHLLATYSVLWLSLPVSTAALSRAWDEVDADDATLARNCRNIVAVHSLSGPASLTIRDRGPHGVEIARRICRVLGFDLPPLRCYYCLGGVCRRNHAEVSA